MAMETDFLTEDAVVFSKTGVDEYNRVVIGPLTPIKVRWEASEEMVQEPDGKVVSLMATVVTDRQITKGSIMWKGRDVDFQAPYSDLMEVYSSSSIPDIKGRSTRNVVKLVRYTNKLPEFS